MLNIALNDEELILLTRLLGKAIGEYEFTPTDEEVDLIVELRDTFDAAIEDFGEDNT